MSKSIEIKMFGQRQKELRCDAAENHQRILASAKMLFATHGVEQVTMAMIAKSAKVGKGTLYRNFANKPVLALMLIDAQMRDFQDGMLVHLRQMNLARASNLAQLAYFLGDLLTFSNLNAPLLYAVSKGNFINDEELQKPHFWQAQIVVGLLNRAVMAGEISADSNTDLLADILLAPTWPPTLNFLLTQREHSLEQIAETLNKLIEGL